MWAPFERQKIEVHIIERANLSGFRTWKFTAKEDLNQPKQVFLLNFKAWPAQKPQIWSIFYGKKFISKHSVVWSLGAFGLKIGTYPRLLVVASYPCRVPCRNYYGLVAGMWHLKSSPICSALPTQKVSMGLVVNLKTMQQPTILVILFWNQRV